MTHCSRKPANWRPPVDAWSCDFACGDGIYVVHMGSQGDAAGPTALDRMIDGSIGGADEPDHVDRLHFVDGTGKHGRMFSCYWRDETHFSRWLKASDAWWSDPSRLGENSGYWREPYTISKDRVETIWSDTAPHPVATRALYELSGPVTDHGYWGSMRDRLPIASTNSLSGPAPSALAARPAVDAAIIHGHHRLSPPENLCVIRSGQDWSGCGQEERETYFSRVEPALRAGMTYLQQNGPAVGCLDCRFGVEVDERGDPLERSFALAQFQSLEALEVWARSHSTHLAIFGSMMKMAIDRSSEIDLLLYHEVFVIAANQRSFDYINCTGSTGILGTAS